MVTSEKGTEIKIRLLQINKRQKWLIDEVKSRNQWMDSSYMTRLLNGTEKNERLMNIIEEIVSVEEARQEAENGKG